MNGGDNLLERLLDSKILIVIRGLDVREAMNLCEILLENDLRFVEVSFSEEDADKVLKALKTHFGGELFLGAGTVFDERNYQRAIAAGADYLLSPGLSSRVAELSRKDRVAYVPGVFTSTDVQNALELGLDVLKLYPADVNLLRSYRGPFPKVKFIPFGGVTDENVTRYFSSGAAAVGVGSYIANKKLLQERNFKELDDRIKKIKSLIGGSSGSEC
ncbi:MAG: Entner-Doudoroff aldolase [Thermotoga sp. 50_1627]|nr:MAG: Entner-Doudoroff aldolase [Thermotoga sp. 50_64]KUK24324.1 MAG: Entner-Doudoroff aldolase [Thermotoga sp. 50_1627]